MSNSLSVIIPVLNEEHIIGDMLSQLLSLENRERIEIIVVDGGSEDGTKEVIQKYPVKLVSAGRGRACQMNEGAKITNSAILFFLHVDSLVPENLVSLIEAEIDAGSDCGCFELAFDHDHILLSAYAWFTRLDINLFRFGDQGLFIRKEVFNEIGGFDDSLLLMEDQDIIRRAKKVGDFSLIRKKIFTSSRKYLETGIIKTQLVFTIILVLYYLGVNQETLKHFHTSIFSFECY